MNKFIENLKAKIYWVYCYKIYSQNKTIFLTSANNNVCIKDETYLTLSNLEFENSESDDNGMDIVKLSGIYDIEGISKNDIIIGSKFEIYIYFPETKDIELWKTLFSINIISYGERFEIILNSRAYELKQDLTQNYSITCRAKLGDSRCKVNMDRFKDETCDKFNNAINFRGEPFIPNLGYFSRNYE